MQQPLLLYLFVYQGVKSLEFQIVANPVDGFYSLFTVAKGGKAEISLAAWTKAGTRRTYNMHIIEELVKEIP